MPSARTYVDDSLIHGRGLYAAEPIPEGTYIGTFKGPPAQRNGSHVLWLMDADGNWFGRRGANTLRYLNHDPDPNAEFYHFDLYATRDIEAGEEITIDYGW